MSCTTRDLMLIQQNNFYWISNRSGVAELKYTVTAVNNKSVNVDLGCCLGYKLALSVSVQSTERNAYSWNFSWQAPLLCRPRLAQRRLFDAAPDRCSGTSFDPSGCSAPAKNWHVAFDKRSHITAVWQSQPKVAQIMCAWQLTNQTQNLILILTLLLHSTQ